MYGHKKNVFKKNFVLIFRDGNIGGPGDGHVKY
jgi:hypothetical protein